MYFKQTQYVSSHKDSSKYTENSFNSYPFPKCLGIQQGSFFAVSFSLFFFVADSYKQKHNPKTAEKGTSYLSLSPCFYIMLPEDCCCVTMRYPFPHASLATDCTQGLLLKGNLSPGQVPFRLGHVEVVLSQINPLTVWPNMNGLHKVEKCSLPVFFPQFGWRCI